MLLTVLPLVMSLSLYLIAEIDSPRMGLIRVAPQNLLGVVDRSRYLKVSVLTSIRVGRAPRACAASTKLLVLPTRITLPVASPLIAMPISG